jgi:hypothetical protein
MPGKALLRRSPGILEVIPGQQDLQSELTLHDPVEENAVDYQSGRSFQSKIMNGHSRITPAQEN